MRIIKYDNLNISAWSYKLFFFFLSFHENDADSIHLTGQQNEATSQMSLVKRLLFYFSSTLMKCNSSTVSTNQS